MCPRRLRAIGNAAARFTGRLAFGAEGAGHCLCRHASAHHAGAHLFADDAAAHGDGQLSADAHAGSADAEPVAHGRYTLTLSACSDGRGDRRPADADSDVIRESTCQTCTFMRRT